MCFQYPTSVFSSSEGCWFVFKFCHFDYHVSGVFLVGFIVPKTLSSLDLGDHFFFYIKKVLAIFSSNIFSDLFSLSSPSCTPIMLILMHLMLPQTSLILSTFVSLSFLYSVPYNWFMPSLFCSIELISIFLSSKSPLCSSCPLYFAIDSF